MRLLFEGGDYNIQGLAGGGYYSRAATISIRGRRLIEEIRYTNKGIDTEGEAGQIYIFSRVVPPNDGHIGCIKLVL